MVIVYKLFYLCVHKYIFTSIFLIMEEDKSNGTDDNTNPTSTDNSTSSTIPDSPKPLAFTIDFGTGKSIDKQRHKTLMDKFQKKHRRGVSMSKIEDTATNRTTNQKQTLTGNLPRKSSFHSSEGYFSSDEKSSKSDVKACKPNGMQARRGELTLPLRNVTSDRMTQSFPNANALASIASPDIELKDVSSPEVDISPLSLKLNENLKAHAISSPESSELNDSNETNGDHAFVDSKDIDFDKSDTVSDAGTYTLDADNYSEEQKARMSIDREFKIEQVTLQKKTEEYVRSLNRSTNYKENLARGMQLINLESNNKSVPKAVLSPILSPTQNMSINGSENVKQSHQGLKIMYPSSKAKEEGLGQVVDQGSFISVTSSGAFRSKSEKAKHERKYSLSKSEVQIQAYVDGKYETSTTTSGSLSIKPRPRLTANIVNVQNIEVKQQNAVVDDTGVVSANLVFEKLNPATEGVASGKLSGCKPSPTKIPSPIHTLRPRSRNSNIDFSDSSLENTELILKPTQTYINALQQRLSLDSETDSDYETKYGIQLNNTAHLLKQRASHTRHNSLDDRTMNNKLEHFQNKNLQGIDQTYNLLSQYSPNRIIKIQNSPNNSPIRRSSSFSINKNQVLKTTNISKDVGNNLCNSPNLTRNNSIQRSSSSACIKPAYLNRRASIEHQKIDRSQFGDTESSSEEDFEKNFAKRKDLSNITNTRCNRAFSLRRARLDEPVPLKCPKTPEMRRKFQPEVTRTERAISVDRKPVKNEVQSRYLQNITKTRGSSATSTASSAASKTELKNVPKTGVGSASAIKSNTNKVQAFARTDTGRFSMRTTKPPITNAAKNLKKDLNGKKSTGGARSNSSLSSKEVEFQNWKRRKSYDPMKAAAEGKKKELAKRQNQNLMTQSFTEANHSQDSSPSHSSSVHRSQSFHGTATLEQLISSEEEEDLTLSADEGFSPPTPSPCELSPARASLRHSLWERIHH